MEPKISQPTSDCECAYRQLAPDRLLPVPQSHSSPTVVMLSPQVEQTAESIARTMLIASIREHSLSNASYSATERRGKTLRIVELQSAMNDE